jgi:hypothetical protein
MSGPLEEQKPHKKILGMRRSVFLLAAGNIILLLALIAAAVGESLTLGKNNGQTWCVSHRSSHPHIYDAA